MLLVARFGCCVCVVCCDCLAFVVWFGVFVSRVLYGACVLHFCVDGCDCCACCACFVCVCCVCFVCLVCVLFCLVLYVFV